MPRMRVGPLTNGLERIAQAAARRPLVDLDDVEDFEYAVPVVQVQLHAADAPLQLHVERRMAVIQRRKVATWLGSDVIAVVCSEKLELIDPQLLDARRLGSADDRRAHHETADRASDQRRKRV